MRRFGLDYDTLAKANPRLIYMSVNAFGNIGPDHNQPGFDPLLQARSGVMAAQGGPHHHPVYLTCAICDYGAAMLSAFGCISGACARGRKPASDNSARPRYCSVDGVSGRRVHFLRWASGHGEWRARASRSSALSRAYQCRDGEWLYLAVDCCAMGRARAAFHFDSRPRTMKAASASPRTANSLRR